MILLLNLTAPVKFHTNKLTIMEKDKDIKNRITELVKESGSNQSEFARSLGLKPSHLSMILSSRDTGISATVLKNFAEIGVNLNWLLLGEGATMRNELDEEQQEKIDQLKTDLRDANNLIDSLERILGKGE